MRLQGKVALITGSTRGIGAAIAQRFASEGARVVLTGRSVADGQSVATAIKNRGGEAIFFPGDIGVEDDVLRVVADSQETFGQLDVLVNNAAPIDLIASGAEKRVHEESGADFERVLRVGLFGAFYATKYGVSAMLASGGGSIVNISSVAGTMGVAGVPAYSCSKGGLQALTRQVAVDYAGDGIRANAIVVGPVLVGQLRELVDADPAVRAALERVTLTRLGIVEDVAGAAAYLASDEAGFMTGSMLSVDGGCACAMPVPDLGAAYADLSG